MVGRVGTFTLSLDLELAWGSWQRNIPKSVFAQGASCALALERLSRELAFPFTWAIVTAVHDLDLTELDSVAATESVAVLRPDLGPFHQTLPTVGEIKRDPDAWLAPQVVQALRSSPVSHDLGTHTYFHATPSTGEGLLRDLAASRKALGCERLESIVYPRDEVAFPEVLDAAGLSNYRSTGVAWYFRKSGKPERWGRVGHTLDQALGRAPQLATVQGSRPAVVQSSAILTLRTGIRRKIPYRIIRRRFLRPLQTAVETGGLYHLWTHPWNLALPASDALLLLEDVCQAAKRLVDAGDLQVQTMADLAHAAEHAE